MSDNDWHASEGLLAEFAADPSTIGHAHAASLEAHLVGCDPCRREIRKRVEPEFLDESWARIAEAIDQPGATMTERALHCVGVPDGWARLLAATPGLQGAVIVSVVAILGLVVVGSRSTETAGAFLVLAPLLPMAAVAASFHPTADPAGEAGVATPLHGYALAVRRTVIVGGAVFVMLAIADIAIGDLGAPVAAWILPSLALTAGAVAGGTWFRIETTVSALVTAWIVAVSTIRWLDGPEVSFADSSTFALPGSVLSVAALVVAVGVIALRRNRFDTAEVFA